jgi:hypothetical protein
MAAFITTVRVASLVCGAAIVSVAAASQFIPALAHAEEASPLSVNLTDPDHVLDRHIEVTNDDHAQHRFAQLIPAPDQADASNAAGGEAQRQLQIEVPIKSDALPFDVSLTQRASFGADAHGDLNQQGHGSEGRVGRALGEPSRRDDNAPTHRIYAFAASDHEALTWTPGHIALQQDRIQVGDRQAGVTYEHGNVQASVAYVEREISATVGRTTASQNENFTGVTLTMRH